VGRCIAISKRSRVVSSQSKLDALRDRPVNNVGSECNSDLETIRS
jgi:hypothetical protein